MKMPEFAVLQEVDSVLLGLWKVFEYSPNKFSVFKEVQTTYGNKSLKLIRAATTIVNVIHNASKFHIKEISFMEQVCG